MSGLMRILQLRLLWPILLLLAAFVIFFEFIADVGGTDEPLPSPPLHPVATASSSPSPAEQWEPSPLAPHYLTPGPPLVPPGHSLD
jgi:hypothetical protein